MKIIIAEDDKWYSELLCRHLELNPDNEVVKVESGMDLLNTVSSSTDLVTLDYSLPDFNGAELLKKIKKLYPTIEVIIVSGQDDVGVAISLLKEGAYDYVVKDEEAKNRIWNSLIHINEKKNLLDRVDKLQIEVTKKFDFEKAIIGNSSKLKSVFQLLEKAAKTNINVSITGETGTGKEVVAKAIHYNSAKSKEPFVTVNMSAIPSGLIESELFGHEKGAFTGASSKRVGKFEEAKSGTIFLDEIGEMDINTQAKLLRVLQERELQKVGGNAVVAIKCRIICATHKNLLDEVNKGNFRQDLYYRIIGLPIELPPLRDRGNDVIVLAKYFMDKFTKENNMDIRSFSDDAIKKMLSYPYPGNVRELKSLVELACVLTDSEEVGSNEIKFTSPNPMSSINSNEKTLRQYDLEILNYYLQKYNENIAKVAEVLGIGRSTIYRMLKEN